MVCPGLGGPEAPAGEKNFAFSGAKTSKSLKKSGAARAMKTILAMKNEDSALDYEKSEDPAKITYSIPDFYDQDPRILPRLREFVTKTARSRLREL